MLKEKIHQLAANYQSEWSAIRRHLHMNPELSFKEFETASYIRHKLTEWGIDYEVKADTGTVATIKGREPNSSLTALRADIDALPIQETNAVPYISKKPGVMHACGHDVHTTSLLGCVKLLKETADDWKGTVRAIFQPGEEMLPGGATLLIKEGVLEGPSPDCILGQHVEPLMPVGKVGLKPGIFMASADEIYVTIDGKGGHGAKPHLCIDPILIASQMIVQMQQVVSRRADPLMPSVLTFGKINSVGGSTNIIPNQVKLMGTFRTFDEKWRYEAHDLLKEMAVGLCRSMGASCDFDIRVGYPFLKNNEDLTSMVKKEMINYLGAENVLDIEARMGGEDFAFYSQQIPATFYRLGVDNPNKTGLHTPTFDIDERALTTGVGLMAWLATQGLSNRM